MLRPAAGRVKIAPSRYPDGSLEGTTMDAEIERKVRERAHALWEKEGRPHGKHLEHWARAKRLVAAEELLADPGNLVTHPETAAHALNDEDE
jgi:hypothetical protein